MSLLSSLFGSSDKKQPVYLPYLYFQRYYQLFNPEIYQVNKTPQINEDAIRLPGHLLTALNAPSAPSFFSPETTWNETGLYDGKNGERVFYGEYDVTPPKERTQQYIYFSILTHELPTESSKARLIPHFLFLGEVVATNQNEAAIIPKYVISRSVCAENTANIYQADLDDQQDVFEALSFADIALCNTLGGLGQDPFSIASAFSEIHPQIHSQKFHFLGQYRSHAMLKEQIADLGVNSPETPSP